MRIGNQPILAPKITHFVVPMGDGQQLVLKLAPVHDFTEFDNLCPEPKGRERVYPGGKKETILDDKDRYAHAEMRIAYMVIMSLKATEDLTWDKVALTDPSTWKNWKEEMKAAGFTEVYLAHLIKRVIDISGLNPELIDKATDAFLAGRAEAALSDNTQTSEQEST